jgi:hypothetical protein
VVGLGSPSPDDFHLNLLDRNVLTQVDHSGNDGGDKSKSKHGSPFRISPAGEAPRPTNNGLFDRLCQTVFFTTLFLSDLGHGAICSKTPISYTETCRTFFFITMTAFWTLLPEKPKKKFNLHEV